MRRIPSLHSTRHVPRPLLRPFSSSFPRLSVFPSSLSTPPPSHAFSLISDLYSKSFRDPSLLASAPDKASVSAWQSKVLQAVSDLSSNSLDAALKQASAAAVLCETETESLITADLKASILLSLDKVNDDFDWVYPTLTAMLPSAASLPSHIQSSIIKVLRCKALYELRVNRDAQKALSVLDPCVDFVSEEDRPLLFLNLSEVLFAVDKYDEAVNICFALLDTHTQRSELVEPTVALLLANHVPLKESGDFAAWWKQEAEAMRQGSPSNYSLVVNRIHKILSYHVIYGEHKSEVARLLEQNVVRRLVYGETKDVLDLGKLEDDEEDEAAWEARFK